jgi:hypothetical protein
MTKPKRPKTNLEAYEFILSLYGKRHGAKTKLANDLGTSRQSVDNYQDSGIPAKHWPKLKQLHGLTPDWICPEYF